MLHNTLLILSVLGGFLTTTSALSLSTTAKSKVSGSELQEFLATSSNWPKIVASSNRVSSATTSEATLYNKGNIWDPTIPMKKGSSITEYFGLNLLSVTWTCELSTKNKLVVRSPDGLAGIANDCSMEFDITDDDDSGGSEVTLTMGYNPLSPTAYLATPILIIDNWIALNVLLPAAVDPNPLDSFRKLMGSLYGIAGLAHLADLLFGPSTLLLMAGAPPFTELPILGQVYALLWCAAGPISFWASRSFPVRGADFGLAFYGLVEVIGAAFTSNPEVLANALAIQGVVGAAWLYSSKKKR